MNTQIRKFFMADDGMGGMDSMFDDNELESAAVKAEYSSGSADPDMYQPKPDDEKAVGKVYKAILRFVPWHKHTAGSKVSRWLYFLKSGDDKFFVDDPTNADPQAKSIITKAYFATWKHDNAAVRSVSGMFKRKMYHWALVQIIEDKQHPELEGKIKIFRFGNQVDELILKQNTEDRGKSKVNVFNPFTGKDFYLDVREIVLDGEKQTSYKESYFAEQRSSIKIDGKHVEEKKENQALVREYLEKNSPDFTKASPQPWDDETHQKVIRVVRDVINQPAIFNPVYKEVYGKDYVKPATDAAASSAPVADANKQALESKLTNKNEVEDIPFEQEEKKADKATPAPEKKTEKAATAAPVAEEEDDAIEFDLSNLPEED